MNMGNEDPLMNIGMKSLNEHGNEDPQCGNEDPQ